MKRVKNIVVLAAFFAAFLCNGGDSAPFFLDTTDELLVTRPIVYDSSWIGGDSSATVVITDNGTEIKRAIGEGEFVWTPTTIGKHTLTYTTFVDGVARDEVYEAVVYADWKYTVEDGKATIVETTQTVGDVTIPAEIDGYPVITIGEDAFKDCGSLTRVTIPDSVYGLGESAFSGCVNLKEVSIPIGLKTQVESGDVFTGCSDELEILYRTAEIKNVTAKQRYPWNGKVDITFEVSGNLAAGFAEENLPALSIVASNRVDGAVCVADATALSGDTGLAEGAHRVVWDLDAQGIELRSDEVEFTIAYAGGVNVGPAIDMEGLVAAYLFDGNIADSSENGLHLVDDGGEFTADRNGVENNAYVFSGQAEKLSSTNDYLRGEFSFAFWCKTAVTMNTSGSSSSSMYPGNYVLFPANSGDDAGFGVKVGTDGISVLGHGSYYFATQLSYSSNIGTGWNHVTVTVSSSGTIKLYLNGVCVKSGTKASSRISAFKPMPGGAEYGYYTGNLDDLLIFDREISSDIVAGIYQEEYSLSNKFNGFDGVVASAKSAGAFVDTTDNPLVQSAFVYDSSWIGSDSSATVLITDNGTEIKRTTGEGEFTWSPTTSGKHTLTYTTYIDGAAQDEVYEAVVYADWKYTVEDGKATIVETTQTVGDITIPSEIDGYPVIGIGDGVFKNCDGLTGITILDCVYGLGKNVFSGCANLKVVSLPIGLKTQVETGDVFSGCSDELEIVYRTAEIKNVTAKQRYPWNGKVDVAFEVDGNLAAGFAEENLPVLSIIASNRVDGAVCVADATTLSGDTGLAEGTHRVVWDFDAQEIELCSDEVEIYVIYQSDEIEVARRAVSLRLDAQKENPVIAKSLGAVLNYNSSWIGSDSSATVLITDNGTEIKRATGQGEFTWAPATIGKHTLTYTTYIDGVAQDEVYEAVVYADWKYTVEDGKATIVETTQTVGDVTIPAEIDGYPVVSIGGGVFKDCDRLTRVTIPDSVTEIGGGYMGELSQNVWLYLEDESGEDYAVYKSNDIDHSESTEMTMTTHGPLEFTFDWKVSSESGYDKLRWYLDGAQQSEISGTGSDWQTITCSIPDGEHTIAWEYSKDDCDDDGDDCGWVRVHKAVESYAFSGCDGLAGVTIPFSLATSVRDIFPNSYDKIESLTLTGEAGEFVDSDFDGCTSLKSIVLPDGIAAIPSKAFAGCAALETVVIPDSVLYMGTGVFEGCDSLKPIVNGNFNLMGDILVGYTGSASKVVIPDGVRGIAGGVFANHTEISEVEFPSTLEFIGVDAFATCTSLKAINLPDSVIAVNDGAFRDCTWVQSVKMPKSLKTIGDAAFANCAYIPSIECADGLEEIGVGAFSNLWRMTSMKLPSSLDVIGKDAFWDCESLSSVTVPAHVQSLSEMLPDTYGTLSSIIIAEGESELCEDVFAGCAGVSEIAIPAEVENIPARAFKNCTGLTQLTLPSSLLSIGDEAFSGCGKISGLVLPDRLATIGTRAFAGLSLLGAVTIPDGVTAIGSEAFSGCSAVRQVYMPANVATVSATFPDAYTKITSVIVPETTTVIMEGFLNGCSSLASFDIPIGVTEIGASAFKNCSALSSVLLPDGLTSIGASAFAGLSLLEVIKIPDGVTAIGSAAFSGCSAVRQVHMPANVATVSATFPDAYSNITSVTVPETATTIITGFLSGCSSLTSFDIPTGVTEIGASAFKNCSVLSGVVLPEGLVSIGASAFQNCDTLGSMAIPSTVTSLAAGSFGGCTRVRSVTIPGDVGTLSAIFPNAYKYITTVYVTAGSEKLCDDIFSGCSALTNIEIPTSVTEIGDGAFENCTSLASVGIPAGVTSLGVGAFSGCSVLSSVTLPGGLAVLDNQVFKNCANLTEITIPASVTQIGSSVFSGCTSLLSVKFVGNAPSVASGSYNWVSASLVTYVPYESTGWDGVSTSMALPKYWPSGYENSIEWWNPVHLIATFDWNYEGGSSTNIEQVVDTTYLLPDTVPTRQEAEFAGWWTAPVGGARVTPTSRVMQMQAHTLYAHWRMNEYSVAFDGNGGQGAMDSAGMTVDEVKALPICSFVRVNHVFAGWATEPEGAVVYTDGAQVKNLSFEQGAVVTLYAVWAAHEWSASDYLNAAGLEFSFEGDLPWGPDTETSHDGVASLRSGAIGASAAYPDRTASTVKTTVVGAGAGSFWWKVHCEEMDAEYGEWYDYAVFTVDGQEVAKIAGDSGWQKVEYTVTGLGEHTLAWTFTRDDYDLEGTEWENAAWLDEVSWTPSPVTATFAAGGATGEAPEAMTRYEGCEITLPGSGTLLNDGYSFVGWSDGETVYPAGAVYTLGGADVTFTAVWEVKVWTFGEAVDSEGMTFETGGDTQWFVDTAMGYTNAVSAKSGAVTSGQSSWLQTTVTGAGTLTFRWKVLGGIYRNNPFAYAKVELDETECASTYLESDWAEVTVTVEGSGEHVIRWTYLRTLARDVEEGDCAWVDAVTWTPAVVADPIPELPSTATAEEVAVALGGSADAELAANITDAANYAAYREWALGVKTADGSAVAGAEAVKNAANTWLSYALDTEKLIANAPVEGDVTIDTFEDAATDGAFDFTVNVKDIAVGDGALEANIRKVFDIEGVEDLATGTFSADAVEVNAAAAEGGKVKFTVTPRGGLGTSRPTKFFFKVRMK